MRTRDDDANQLIAKARQMSLASKKSAEELLAMVLEGQKLIEQSKLLLERCRQRYP